MVATLGIDVGTQGARVVALGPDGAELASARRSWTIRTGADYEQDPAVWWKGVLAATAEVGAATRVPITALSVTATSGTLVLADADMRPVRPAMLWNDKRASDQARRAAETLGDPAIRPGFTLPKAMWVREHEGARWAEAEHLLSAGDWLLARITGAPPVTDITNALKTGADLDLLEWPDALEDLGIPLTMVPPIVLPGAVLGSLGPAFAAATGLASEVRVHAGVTDANAALIAAGVVNVGTWVTTIGTGLSVKGVTDARLSDATGAIYSHRHWQRGWIPSGTSHCGADSIATAFPDADLDALTEAAWEPSRVLVLPLATIGEVFPFRAPAARGFEVGEPRCEADRFRGYLEGIAFVERSAMERFAVEGAGGAVGPQASMGGGASNDAWMRIRASVLGRQTTRPLSTSSAVGAAIIAAAGDADRIGASTLAMVRKGSTFDPEMALVEHYAERYAAFTAELQRRGYLDEDSNT